MKADQVKVLQSIKEAVDAFANAFNPCDMCDNKKDVYAEDCALCCYYYPSKFEPKKK